MAGRIGHRIAESSGGVASAESAVGSPGSAIDAAPTESGAAPAESAVAGANCESVGTASASRAALIRYLAAAAFVRTASGGATVGLFSLAVAHSASGHGAALGGALAALLTAPYVVGPWLARLLDSARDGRVLLSASFAVFGAALTAAGLCFGRLPTPAVAALITVAGLCGPLVTGGLSSRLAGIAGPSARVQRRCEGWDSATYGIGNTFGPALVGLVGAAVGPVAAVAALGGAAGLAALLVLTLPPRERRAPGAPAALHVSQTFRIIATVGPLRRMLVVMMLTALVAGGMTVVATTFGRQLAGSPAAGAALASGYGLGYLAGSVLVGLAPPRGEPERVALRLTAVGATAVAACALAPDYAFALVSFAAAGAASATLFTATLAVRSVYSPPEARAQIYVSMGGVKMAVASLGTAVSGAAMSAGPRTLLAAGVVVVAFALAVAFADRRITVGTPGPIGAAQISGGRRPAFQLPNVSARKAFAWAKERRSARSS